jgi:H/ACA ribonucleoprotein complex subunit 4
MMPRIILDAEAKTSDKHGSPPSQRSIDELLSSCYLVMDKPAGPSSHQASAWARDILGIDKLGHGGTLDPFATGVIVLLAGQAMRLTSKVLAHDKQYICVFRSSEDIDSEAFAEALSTQIGEVYNVPPKESAVKIQVRSRKVSSAYVLDISGRDAVVAVTCESGTYIRTMARDIGLLLGNPVVLKELRRSRSGRFTEDNSVSLQEIADAFWLWREHGEEVALRRILTPVESLVKDMPSIVVKDGGAAAMAHGAPLLRPGIASLDSGLAAGDTVAIFTLKGEIVATATMVCSSEEIAESKTGEAAKASAVFLNPEAYPKTWGKS